MVSSKKYEVFLSFRGEDTRTNFTSHLHEALKKKEVETFIDYELRKGDEISPALIQDIENSLVSIVILSPNYASSKWCLEERSKILECRKKQGQMVIPVFYNVDPSHVRNQKLEAMSKPLQNIRENPITTTESELFKEIIGDVLQKLTPNYRNQHKGLVGIEESYEQIESLLKIGSTKVITIGLWVSGIEVLLDKALITISNYNEIEMHDLIQQMGQEIVYQESIKDHGRRSRLWKHDEVYEVLKYNKVSGKFNDLFMELMMLKNLDTLTEDLCLSSDFLAKMPNVRFLKIHTEHWSRNKFNVSLPHGLESFTYKLRYLGWEGFCLESLPSNFCAKQLVKLDLSLTKVKRLWDGVQDLSNLKTILLDDLPELVEIPDLSMARKLERISLKYCISLRELHPSITSLPKLTALVLYRCSKIDILKVHSKSL
uniref:TMV resistance protein N n=1 Tax=Cajanus cajan TaxID=3821 RepID=A0A151SQM7_CAJCA|nr:TMV resistance protein N [Cajanus cajan]